MDSEEDANLAFEAWCKTYDGLRSGVIGTLSTMDMLDALRLAFTSGYGIAKDDAYGGDPRRRQTSPS